KIIGTEPIPCELFPPLTMCHLESELISRLVSFYNDIYLEKGVIFYSGKQNHTELNQVHVNSLIIKENFEMFSSVGCKSDLNANIIAQFLNENKEVSDDNVNKSLKTKTNSNNNSNSRRRKSLNSLMITTESPIKRLNKKSMNTSKLTEKINPKTTIVNDVSNKLSSKNKSPTKQQQFNKPFLSKAPKTTTTMSTTKCVSSPLSIFPYYQEEKIDTVNVVSTTTTSQSLSPSSPGSRKQNLDVIFDTFVKR
ncbi:16260_t:CDS:2, partial [Entrophospora sp. SA101]